MSYHRSVAPVDVEETFPAEPVFHLPVGRGQVRPASAGQCRLVAGQGPRKDSPGGVTVHLEQDGLGHWLQKNAQIFQTNNCRLN